MPKLSFVVSAFNRPAMLPVVLHALAVQTMPDFEVFVADNSDGESRELNRQSIDAMDRRFCHIETGMRDCYSAAELVVENYCRGDFLCFPSDDSYYVPCFAEVMLAEAESKRLDLVYCNMVYDARFSGQCYSLVDVHPMVNSIDKTGFILARKWFKGFPGKTEEGPCTADGQMIEALLRQGIRHGKVNDILMVHN